MACGWNRFRSLSTIQYDPEADLSPEPSVVGEMGEMLHTPRKRNARSDSKNGVAGSSSSAKATGFERSRGTFFGCGTSQGLDDAVQNRKTGPKQQQAPLPPQFRALISPSMYYPRTTKPKCATLLLREKICCAEQKCSVASSRAAAALVRIIINLMDQTIRRRNRVIHIVTRTEEAKEVTVADLANKCNLQGWSSGSSETSTRITTITGGGSVHKAEDCRSAPHHRPSINRHRPRNRMVTPISELMDWPPSPRVGTEAESTAEVPEASSEALPEVVQMCGGDCRTKPQFNQSALSDDNNNRQHNQQLQQQIIIGSWESEAEKEDPRLARSRFILASQLNHLEVVQEQSVLKMKMDRPGRRSGDATRQVSGIDPVGRQQTIKKSRNLRTPAPPTTQAGGGGQILHRNQVHRPLVRFGGKDSAGCVGDGHVAENGRTKSDEWTYQAAEGKTCADLSALKPDVRFTEKGVSDLAQHFLLNAGILAIHRIRKTEDNRLARAYANHRQPNGGTHREGRKRYRASTLDCAQLPGILRLGSPLVFQQAARRNPKQPKEHKIKPLDLSKHH
ncbi:chaperonin [Culex quinquefasciatus]|uniref:Chaperonin n=1 Tax=Culex quinquefasciatus TaxID=7176 RepID=B0XHN3_CULQU|nr:chaperonin [Culex quinquefasciatus]|eukprot:XP_001869155.1 chaperonin [Culex quinquefasciatus]